MSFREQNKAEGELTIYCTCDTMDGLNFFILFLLVSWYS